MSSLPTSRRSSPPGRRRSTTRACSPSRTSALLAFEDHGEALADADAERHRCVLAARLLQLARDGEREARARGAERVADGDRAAVRIHARVLEVDVHQLEAAEHLAGERLVDF